LASGGGAGAPMTWATPGGTGTVTSVAMTTPAFLTTTGSPITSSGTLALTLSGTALPVLNGGTGVTTSTGTGSTVRRDSPTFTTDLTTPYVNYAGSSSGTISVGPQPNTGNYNFNLPTTAGTAGQVLTSAAGGFAPMTWEGTPKTAWTPVLAGYGGTPGITIVTTASGGWYSVHNSLCTVWFDVQFSYGATLVDTIVINNLPLTPTTRCITMQDAAISNWVGAGNPVYTKVGLTTSNVFFTNATAGVLVTQIFGSGTNRMAGLLQFYI
jgi:hypothetical protein